MSNKIFYISDAHISHRKVIDMDERPFRTIEEHDEAILNNWNSVVGKNDLVCTLGDMHWGKSDEVYEFVKQLNGRKMVIRGNHTLKKFPSKLCNLFEDVCDYKEIKDNGRRVILSHYPILFYRGDYDPNTFHLFGHVHETIENDFVNHFKQYIKEHDTRERGKHMCQFYNVGACLPYINYTPRTLDEILEANGDK